MGERDRPAVLTGHRDVVAMAAQTFRTQEAVRAELVPSDVAAAATGGVHGEHDLVLHRPIADDDEMRTTASLWGTRPAGRNALVTLRYESVDRAGSLVAEQWWTTVYLGSGCEVTGSPAPDHSFPEAVRAEPAAVHEVEVDEDMARRYAELSGDWTAHHFDVDAARRSGAERPFLHGLCTMALCAEVVAGGAALRRVAVRFARPMLLGDQLRVAAYRAGPGVFAFEAFGDEHPVITNGVAELR